MTSLLIPNQEGTSDTCTTKDEEAIFEHQDKNGLITLGWIHVSYTNIVSYSQNVLVNIVCMKDTPFANVLPKFR